MTTKVLITRQADDQFTARTLTFPDIVVSGSTAAEMTIDEPDDPAGAWWLNMWLTGHAVEVGWRPAESFGLAFESATDDLFSRPDAVFPTAESIKRAIHDANSALYETTSNHGLFAGL